MSDEGQDPDAEVDAGPETESADDTTAADMGMVGGSGATSGESTVHPYGTDKDDPEDRKDTA